MARFRTYGQLDDPHATDGDVAFVRWVSQINPEQLGQGEVAYSQNGRMDNDRSWQPRKGLEVFATSDINGSMLRFDDSGGSLSFDDAGTPPSFTDGIVEAVWGSSYFNDPITDTEYLMIANNATAVAINLSDKSETTIYYPEAASAVDGQAELIQALDSVLLFQDGETAWKFDGDVSDGASDTITGADLNTTVAGDVWIETDNPHGLSVNDVVTISGVGFGLVDPNGTYRVATVANTQEFSYDLSGAAETYTTTGSPTYTSKPKFELVSDSATTIVVDAGVSVTVEDGLATVTSTAHGRSTGDIVTVYDEGATGLVPGDRYEITKVDANTFTTHVELADGTYTVTIGDKQPLSGGYIAMPEPAWGVYHEGRLIVPYARDLSVGTSDDEIVFSDIFDLETYDPILNQLRFSSGSNDSLVGVAPLLQDRLLVFCRRSVHVVNGISGSLADVTKYEVTREIGCVARKSIVEVGGTIMWLSDQGVYSATYGQELNLIANALPLSEPIENTVRRINWEYASNAVAGYADNRYYLAVPLDDSTVNNVVLVYNFLNKGWESLDTYPEGFDIANMILVPFRGKNELFFVNTKGAVHRTEQTEGADSYQRDVGEGNGSNKIEGLVVTRRHVFGTMDTKRYNRASVLAEGVATNGSLTTSIVVVDPEQESVIDRQVAVRKGEDYNLRGRIGKRGYGAQLKFETNSAKVRGYTIDAIVQSRSNTDRE